MHSRPWAFALLTLVAVSGCNKGSDATNTPGSGTATAALSTATTGAATATTTGAATPSAAPASGLKDLKIDDVKVGKGAAAANGDTIWVLYTGHITNPSGKVFDSTDSHMGKAFAVNVGGGEVIKGWDKGLVGMKVGGERNLWIPYKMAYGDEGNDTIPAKTDLFFNVKAVALVKKGDENLVDVAVKKPGTGPSPKPGDKVTVTYVGKLPTGEEFDNSSSKPVSFTVGRADANGVRAMPGLDIGIQNMKVGEEAILTIPPKLGKPAGSMDIPANSVIIYDITLKKIG